MKHVCNKFNCLQNNLPNSFLHSFFENFIWKTIQNEQSITKYASVFFICSFFVWWIIFQFYSDTYFMMYIMSIVNNFISYIFSMCVSNLYVSGYFHSLMTHLKSCCECVFLLLLLLVFHDWWCCENYGWVERNCCFIDQITGWTRLSKTYFSQIFTNLQQIC